MYVQHTERQTDTNTHTTPAIQCSGSTEFYHNAYMPDRQEKIELVIQGSEKNNTGGKEVGLLVFILIVKGLIVLWCVPPTHF